MHVEILKTIIKKLNGKRRSAIGLADVKNSTSPRDKQVAKSWLSFAAGLKVAIDLIKEEIRKGQNHD